MEVNLQAHGIEAFHRIRGSDRNTFHHLNPDVPTDLAELERRAEECVNALYQIESEVFAVKIVKGKLAPKRPEYWPKTGPHSVAVLIRALGH